MRVILTLKDTVLIDIANTEKVKLEEKGQPSDFAEQGVQLLNGLKEKDSEQEGKKESNKESTQERYIKFNELIKIVNEINKLGRKEFKKNPAKYVLFKSPWPKNGGGNDDSEPQNPEPEE